MQEELNNSDLGMVNVEPERDEMAELVVLSQNRSRRNDHERLVSVLSWLGRFSFFSLIAAKSRNLAP